MEKKTKKKNDTQGTIITAFVIVVVTIGFIGGFVLAGDLKDRIYRANEKESSTTESSDILIAGGKSNKTLGFDEKYVESNYDLDYSIDFGTYAGSTNEYFTLQYGDNKKDLLITTYSYDSDYTQEYTMSFPSNVVDVYLGRFNNDPQRNTIFYLLDNGDVCYSLIEDMVQNNQYGSYYTIEDLTHIAKFYNGTSCDPENSLCNSTTFVQDKNGKIYDLNNYIK
jgi:hypothetical protein